MISDAASAGLAGLDAATRRLDASAHNVANTRTRDFRPLEVRQAVDASGLPQATTEQSPEARQVDLAEEAIAQMRAQTDALASLRVIEADLELKSRLVDLG